MLRVLGSRHIGRAIHVTDSASVRALLDGLRSEYPDATHIAYAWRLGWKKEVFRHSDDGEPSGTAGRPIFGQLQSFDLTDVCVAVVRYYGGTKLGTGGLTEAYKTAARLAIEDAGYTEQPVRSLVDIAFAFSAMPQVMKLTKVPAIEKIKLETGENCRMSLSIPLHLRDRLLAQMAQVAGAQVISTSC
jgi:uncharacterized YigZ family protein